jgi:putative DNA primase/helicase
LADACAAIERELRANDVRESGATNGAANVRDEVAVENLTDMGNSSRMARIHMADIKHSIQLGWLSWDGTRFKIDDTQEIERRARETVRSIYMEAAEETDKDRRAALAEWARKSESEQRINAMIRLCESEEGVAVRADVFNRDPWMLNVRNGTLDLRTGKLRAQRREDFITKICPVAYDPQAPCTTWYKFLEKIFADDLDLATYVQKIAGYALTGDVREQEFYLFHGLGANGKTTLVKTLLRALGDYSAQSPVETFIVKKHGGIPNDVARLAGARLVVATESEANQQLAESLVKALTGGDKIAARFLHKEFFEFEPSFKLILSTNHKPRIIGTDIAIWRRVRLVPFAVTIPTEEQDKELPTKLEAELPGILRWMVEGCLLWQREGLKPPSAVAEASEAYKQDSDVLSEFIETRCEVGPMTTMTAKDGYAAYVEWSEENKQKERERLSHVRFGMALAERGFIGDRNWKGRFWRGIGLLGSSKAGENE